MVRVSLRTVTMRIPSQKIITKDNVSIDIAAVAYYHISDPEKAVIVIENVYNAINKSAKQQCAMLTTDSDRSSVSPSWQTSAAGCLQHTESLFAENREPFFNAFGHKRKSNWDRRG